MFTLIFGFILGFVIGNPTMRSKAWAWIVTALGAAFAGFGDSITGWAGYIIGNIF